MPEISVTQPNSAFLSRFVCELLASCYAFQAANHDELRFPESWAQRAKRGLRERLLQLAASRQFMRLPRTTLRPVQQQIEQIVQQQRAFENLYQTLADDASRDLLISLLVFRTMGRDRVRLPSNNPAYWSKLNQLDDLVVQPPVSARPNSSVLELFDLANIGVPVQLRAQRMNVLHTYLLEQYCYRGSGATLSVDEGDVVFDGGGCWGDTALYFANRVGENGRVFSFEFLPKNLATFEENLAGNPSLRDRIEIVRRPLWNVSGEHC